MNERRTNRKAGRAYPDDMRRNIQHRKADVVRRDVEDRAAMRRDRKGGTEQ